MRDEEFIPSHYDIFGGLDVGKTSIAETFMSHEELLKDWIGQ